MLWANIIKGSIHFRVTQNCAQFKKKKILRQRLRLHFSKLIVTNFCYEIFQSSEVKMLSVMQQHVILSVYASDAEFHSQNWNFFIFI